MSKQQMTYSARHHGFSIVEVMFAIMILGIGFILVAAMFPVAIQQNQATVDETRVRIESLNGAYQLFMEMRLLPVLSKPALDTTPVHAAPAHQVYRYETMPGTPAIPPATLDLVQLQNLYRTLRTNMDEPGYSWLMAYSYDYEAWAPNPILNMTIFGLKTTTISGVPAVFADKTAFLNNTSLLPTNIDLQKVPGGPTRILIDPATPNFPAGAPLSRVQEAAVESGVLLIPADVIDNTVIPSVTVLAAGAVLRIGNRVDLATTDIGYQRTWELAPDSAQPAKSYNGAGATLLGRSLRYPTVPWGAANPHEGASQVLFVTQLSTVLN